MKEKYILFILLVLFLSLLSISAMAQEQDLEKRPNYTGIMLFLQERRDVIMVAPTLDEERRDAGRLSCDRKKAFLEKFFTTKVKIIDDRKLTEEDKKKDLIIVGKDNALLKEIWELTTIRVTPDNFFFASEEFNDPRDHAIFFQVNPFNEAKRLLVTTSVNPDLDKIRPFPFSGSDWIVMRDLTYLKQGRYQAGSSLPPRVDIYASMDHREKLVEFSSSLARIESQFYEVYYSPNSLKKEKIKQGIKKREEALSTILKDNNLKPLQKKIKLFCYKNSDEKKEQSGVPDPVHFLGQTKEVHMVQDTLFADTFHEDAHVVAELILSDDAAAHITEGFAIYIDGKWKGDDLDFVAGYYLKINEIPPMTFLLDEGEFSKLPVNLSFPLMGSLAKYFIEKYGVGKFQKLLDQKKIDNRILKGILGLDLKQLQLKWEEDIKRRSAVYAKKISFTKHNLAAQKFTAQSDFKAAAEELLKALEYLPNDPQALFNLASSYMRIPKLKEAEETLLKILSLKLPESEFRFIVFGHYQLARVYDLMEKREKAISEYEKVLELPDMHDSHNLASEGLALPASLEDLLEKP